MAKTYSLYTFFILLVLLFASSCGVENEPDYILTTQAVPAEAGTVIQSAGGNPDSKAIKISAKANEHWEFIGWAGDLSGTSDSTVFVFMDQNREIQALFEKVDYPVTIHVEGEGNVSTELVSQKTTTEEFQHASVLRLVAEPTPGWRLSEWSGDASGSENEVEVVVDGPVEVTATFERIDYELIINIEGEGEVTQEFVLPKTTSSEYPFETVVQLTAEPETGWEIESWSGDASGSEETVMIEMDGNKEVTVQFKRTQFSVNIQINGSGTFITNVIFSPEDNIASDTQFPFGSVVNIQALPETNWSFTGWSGDKVSTNSGIEILIDGNKNLVLDFLPFKPNSGILQLGDSITKGAPYSYRFLLYHLLSNANLKFQYVGTQNSNPASYPGEWDQSHESYDGVDTKYIADNISTLSAGYTTDTVLLHIGTNDIISIVNSNGSSAALSSSVNNLISIIDQLRAKNPFVRIYLAKILPMQGVQANQLVQSWNQNLQSIAETRTTAQSPIRIVDMNSGITEEGLDDGIHPKEETSRIMARRWFDALTAF